ncbi:MAG: endonuclease/exonuclease/phosphatase family protein [Xanthomonadales bacterium]|nr:endonuclease/exonuclease/phosphatase family protein [Xanthomonadales bacterium]
MQASCRFVLTILTLCLCACATRPGPTTVRFATFNAAMGLQTAGDLQSRLQSGDDPALMALAAILQRTRPDVVLLNEFDHQQGFDNAAALIANYLKHSQHGDAVIDYPWAYQATVNTGVNSLLDLDKNGITGEPGDAWGYGVFPGQYGMLVLSRYPIEYDQVRSFRLFRWRDMPGALKPRQADGAAFYSPRAWRVLRLSSKNHLDLPLSLNGSTVHFLVSHPTPPVFDGPEDRNGRRNHDEIRLWADYVSGSGDYLLDDSGVRGGLQIGARFVIAGDQNSDPLDGDSLERSISRLLDNQHVNASCLPASSGGAEAARLQGGVNARHRGNPALDTSDFSDRTTGNLRLDYVLPSRNLETVQCGVFWPAAGEPGHDLIQHSDHRLVWLDVRLPAGAN